MSRKAVSQILFTNPKACEDAHEYPAFEKLIAERVATAKDFFLRTGAILRTDVSGLFEKFLAFLPSDSQHYKCKCCKSFIENYGGLVAINDDGSSTPILWDAEGVPEFFKKSVSVLNESVKRANVVGPFYSKEQVWGTPTSGGWSHLSGKSSLVYVGTMKTDSQAEAEKLEDFRILQTAIAGYPKNVIEQAHRILEADALTRSEKAVGVAKWLLELVNKVDSLKSNRRKNNYLWREVVKAPAGFCHIRSSMIGTLLDDLVQGMDIETVKKRWASKMHPLQYQRPTTVTAGNLARAEKVVKELESAGALQRRFARLTDITAIWTPRVPKQANPDGVFGLLKPTRQASPANGIELPQQTMTWEKFERTILPTAEQIECYVQPGKQHFYGLVTAQNENAAQLMQWDTDPRNPTTWYFYMGGSTPSDWNLSSGAWVRVNAAMYSPPHWHHPETFKHFQKQVFLALDGCRDLRYRQGAAFFPECLRSEYHEIRSSMEAYANQAVVQGSSVGDANGLSVAGGTLLKVISRLGTMRVNIDRLD